MSYHGMHKRAAMNDGATAALIVALLGNYKGRTGIGIVDAAIFVALMLYLIYATRNAIAHGISAARQ